jgi:acetylornithine deacetylase/succinyl-diaminopimelate desuccinylase-like protein
MMLPNELIATMHGVDERVPADALGPAVRVVYEALRQL